MKKILILVVLLLLCSCSSKANYSFVSDDNEVLFKGPKTTYTKADLYKSLKISSESSIANNILKNIALSYDDVNLEELEKLADDFVNTYIELGYESYIISSYGSIENYKKAYLESLLINELASVYVNDNYDSLLNENKPIMMQVASFSEIENAEKCIEDFNNGSTFDMAAVNNSSLTTAVSNIYTDTDSTLPFEVKDYLNSTNATGVSSIITHSDTTTTAEGTTTENNTYYVLNIESRNVEDFKDDFIQLLASELSIETIEEYFFNKHEIKFYDQDLYEVMTNNYEVLR